ncbi:MAG TPA: sulfatase-like hydrolase/transferase [Ramlibacter sp.]|nr:sulfatase-like hydrolase/transferase [Ramlibacter sp.]
MRFPFSFLAYFAAFFLLGFSHWLGASFDDPSIDQILYHLHYSEGMGVDIGRIFLITFAAECLGFPLLFAAGSMALQSAVLRLMTRSNRHRLRRAAGAALPAMTLCCGVAALMAKLSVFSWIGYHFAEDRFSPHFVDAAQVRVQPRPGQLKNLVLIYVESLEDTYADANVWGRDLLLPLRNAGGVSFGNYRPAPGTNWTIAGMVASQCGVPLRIVSQSDVKPRGGNVRAFLPGATCLGDILHAHGYRNVFLGGAPLSFAGKGKFLQDHHYDEAFGREEWQKAGVDPKTLGEWGLYDDELYARAKLKLRELHASGQRFNLTLLTLDTHNPNGFRSPTCTRRGLRSFEDIIECASWQAADFVQFIQSAGYLQDTNVVILGDHLAVSNTIYEALREIHDRRIFNQFISQEPARKNTEDILPFDLFPSILEFVGFEVPQRRLGLGYSALGAPAPQRANDRLADLVLPSLSGSASYGQLWEAR